MSILPNFPLKFFLNNMPKTDYPWVSRLVKYAVISIDDLGMFT